MAINPIEDAHWSGRKGERQALRGPDHGERGHRDRGEEQRQRGHRERGGRAEADTLKVRFNRASIWNPMKLDSFRGV